MFLTQQQQKKGCGSFSVLLFLYKTTGTVDVTSARRSKSSAHLQETFFSVE